MNHTISTYNVVLDRLPCYAPHLSLFRTKIIDFSNRKALKNNSSLLIFTNHKRIGHAIIPKPHCSSREGINSYCRHFNRLIFAVLAQSVQLSITAVVAAPTGRWPFNCDRIVTSAAGPFNSQMREGRLS